MVSVYPLPSGTPDYATAANMVAAQNDILSYVIQAMAGVVDQSICTQQQQLDSVARTLLSSACGRVSSNGRALAPVANALITQGTVACSESQLLLNRVTTDIVTGQPVDGSNPLSQPATPAILTEGPPLPGCVLAVLRPAQTQVQYPSGDPVADVSQNRSAAFAYNQVPGGQRTYFSVPSAAGPALGAGSFLVGYYDIPAQYLPVTSGANSDRLWVCPAAIPPPGTGQGGGSGTQVPLVQWYCGTNFAGSLVVFQQAGGITPEIYATYQSIKGPFATQAQAAAVCMGATPTPTPQPQPVEEWYCVTSTNPNGEQIWNVFQFDGLAAINATSWKYVSGPFPTQALAQANCTAVQEASKRISSCPAVALPNIPEWCSINVCNTIDAITAAVSGIGSIDIFRFIGAGTLDNPAPKGTWLGDLKDTPLVGNALYTIATTALCVLNGLANAAIIGPGPQTAAFALANGGGILVGMLEKYFSSGFTDLHRKFDYWADYQSPTVIPSVGEADTAFVRGYIDEKQWRCWVRANNVCDEPHRLIRDTQFLRPGWRDAERLSRIGLIEDEDRDSYFVRAGIGTERDRAMFRALYNAYPGFSDVISFMVRDVFDATVVEDAGLDLEFDQKYTGDAERLGSIAGLDRDTARLYWMAHWIQPATQHLYEMLYRLRPGKVPPYLEVTRDDVEKQLGINDIAPSWRDKLIEISYRPVSIRQARQFYQNYVIDKAAVESLYLDHGYVPDQAKAAADNEEVIKPRARAQLSRGWTVAAIAAAYAVGAMSDEEASDRMLGLGFDAAETEQMKRRAKIERQSSIQKRAESRSISSSWTVILKAYNTGSISRDQAGSFLKQQGWSDTSIALALNAEDVRSRQTVVQQAVRTVRQSYLSAEIGLAVAGQQLAAIGVAPPRVQEYLATWQLQLTGKRRVLSGQQALRLFREGLISRVEVETRLNLLGWRNPDLTYQVQEAINARNAAAAKVAAAAAKAQSVAAAQLAREVKAQQALVAQTQRRLCGMVPVERMVKWFGLRYVEMPWFLDRLNTCGYTQDAITGYVDEALAAREKADAAKQKAASKSSTGNGTATP